jgi:Holliday junction resolvasome RuvABC endonuclease subunit
MTIVSIDFSILYPGICICRDFKDFKWLAGINTTIRKKDQPRFEEIESKYPAIKFFYTESRRKKESEYYLTERIKLKNYHELISKISKELKGEITDPSSTIIAIEGISFGSSGNSLVDIAQATGMLKLMLVDEVLDGDSDRIFIFSPSELKNAIGCKGNAGKLEIFEKFKEDPVIDSSRNSDLHKLVSTEDWVIEKEKVISPIIDMVDSYLGIVKIHQLLKSS